MTGKVWLIYDFSFIFRSKCLLCSVLDLLNPLKNNKVCFHDREKTNLVGSRVLF